MSTFQEVHKSLLDDLRAATEFYNATGDRAQPETKETAREWLANAALNLGKALIAQDATSEAPHA